MSDILPGLISVLIVLYVAAFIVNRFKKEIWDILNMFGLIKNGKKPKKKEGKE